MILILIIIIKVNFNFCLIYKYIRLKNKYPKNAGIKDKLMDKAEISDIFYNAIKA